MASVRLYLLGPFRVERDSQPVRLPTRKLESLLAYLALHPEPHTREKLATLLWGDTPDAQARASLRNALPTLRRTLGDDLLLVDREAVQLNPQSALWVDALVAVANLKLPTHRRCLILTRQLLEGHGRAELHDELLRLLGYHHLTREQVERYLQAGAEAFDRAVQVARTPVQFGFKLCAHVRPYIIDAAQEMVDAGHHREAMFWIGGFLVIANGAIQADAPPADRPYFQATVDGLLADLGLDTLQAVAVRVARARVIAEAVFKLADEMVTNTPDIVDG